MRETISDQEILERIVNGDRRELQQFYQENFEIINNYIKQYGGHTADTEDIFQDALVVLYEKQLSEDLILHCTLNTYFYAICKNLWRNRYRKQQRIALIDDMRGDQDTQILIEEAWEYKEEEALYQKHFLQLGTACQQLFRLVFEKIPMKTIASRLGYTDAYARVKHHDCKKALIKSIKSDPSYKDLTNTTSK